MLHFEECCILGTNRDRLFIPVVCMHDMGNHYLLYSQFEALVH